MLTAARVERIESDAVSLVARAQNGDVSALKAVYHLNCQRVFTVCAQLTADQGEAERWCRTPGSGLGSEPQPYPWNAAAHGPPGPPEREVRPGYLVRGVGRTS